jgi:hydroxymethylpyrimidine pyrophosphatase-like HAD family hydrolase
MAFDVDGTLLDSQGRMSPATWGALRRCSELGILLYVATARPQRLVFGPGEAPADACFLAERGVFYNGASAVDRPLSFSRDWPMPADLVAEVTELAVEAAPDFQITIQAREDYHSYRFPVDDSVLQGWGFGRHELLPFERARQMECSKIVVWHAKRSAVHLHRLLTGRLSARATCFLGESGRWVTITSSETGKDTALLTLLALRAVDAQDVVAFGDAAPDAPMLAAVGRSVAMADAPVEVLERATYVTRSSDEDGVAYAIHEYLGIR